MKTTTGQPAHLVWIMLFLVYISWGSVYIGNKLSLEIAGPFLVCGLRNFLAGVLMVLVARLCKGWRTPTLADLRSHALMAILLVGGSGGLLVLGQTEVSSSVTGVIMSCTPIFMLIGAFLFAGEQAPNLPQCIGMLTGACGIIFLSWSEQSAGTSSILGVLILLGGVACWVSGSLIMKKIPIGKDMSILESTGLILLLGGLECMLVGVGLGEQNSIHWENLRPDTIIAFAWMVIGGSFIAYGSYLWLLAHVSVSLAVSYEYVVPVIGIILGYAVGGETISRSTIVSCLVIIGSVFLVVRHRHSFKAYIRHYLVRKYQYHE